MIQNGHDPLLSPLKNLIAHAHTFDFAQAVSLLQYLRPHRTLGGLHGVGQEPVKFQSVYSFKGQQPDLSYVWVPLSRKSGEHDPPQPVMMVNFISLLGIQGPMSYDLSDMLVIDSVRRQHPDQQRGVYAFFDIFHHRLITLWFKVFCRIHPLLMHTPYENSMMGRIMAYLTPYDEVCRLRQHMLLSCAALFWQRSRTAVGLEVMIRSIFHISCHLKLFEGGWNRGRIQDGTQLGRAFHKVGESVIIGHQTFDQRKGFSLYLATLSYDIFQGFLPTPDPTSAYALLLYLVQRYMGDAHTVSVYVTIPEQKMPPMQLCATSGTGSCLGYTTALPYHTQSTLRKNDALYTVRIA